MHIRQATIFDVEQIHDIEKQCFSQPWSLKDIYADLVSPVATYFVATIDNSIVGYIGFWNVVGEGQLTNLAVKTEARGMGIANQLIKKVIDQAKIHSGEYITLEVRQSNHIASHLYKKYDFKEIAVRKAYYKEPTEDATIMKLNL
ncbi:MAG: ribosomal-protein-alanine N-acetyltransferase [Epulopiscium sp. Nuni2H_MBin003]|nr:MAG: ribosomal-protein-alanine N-acetyltransferase [Epulopiscium sp. Nuni2H_MBin003]